MKDYKARFINEYDELVKRREKLHDILIKHQAGTLDFKPICPFDLLMQQYEVMTQYKDILEIRAQMEGIDLTQELIIYE